ncbi:MAG: hypothetical protein ABJM29_12275 [Rhizobiaceae bacterium]
MSVNCNTPSLPVAQSPFDNWLKTLRKRLTNIKQVRNEKAISRHAPPLDEHLRRDIGLPDAEARPDRYMADWSNPISVDFRRRW